MKLNIFYLILEWGNVISLASINLPSVAIFFLLIHYIPGMLIITKLQNTGTFYNFFCHLYK